MNSLKLAEWALWPDAKLYMNNNIKKKGGAEANSYPKPALLDHYPEKLIRRKR
jgi:hypothetical protein